MKAFFLSSPFRKSGEKKQKANEKGRKILKKKKLKLRKTERKRVR